jgi:hypothetical protein
LQALVSLGLPTASRAASRSACPHRATPRPHPQQARPLTPPPGPADHASSPAVLTRPSHRLPRALPGRRGGHGGGCHGPARRRGSPTALPCPAWPDEGLPRAVPSSPAWDAEPLPRPARRPTSPPDWHHVRSPGRCDPTPLRWSRESRLQGSRLTLRFRRGPQGTAPHADKKPALWPVACKRWLAAAYGRGARLPYCCRPAPALPLARGALPSALRLPPPPSGSLLTTAWPPPPHVAQRLAAHGAQGQATPPRLRPPRLCSRLPRPLATPPRLHTAAPPVGRPPPQRVGLPDAAGDTRGAGERTANARYELLTKAGARNERTL